MGLKFNNVIAGKFNALKDTTLSGHYVFKNKLDETDLERRFSKPQAIPHNIQVEITSDPIEMESYYRIRGYTYKTVLHSPDDVGHEEYHDKVSHIMVVKNGPVVIGGGRITVSTPQNNISLPLQHDEINLAKYFPALDFANIAIAEPSRIAVLPEFANGLYMAELYSKMLEWMVPKYNLGLVAYMAYPTQARRMLTFLKRKGYDVVCREDIDSPHFSVSDEIKLKLYIFDTTPDKRHHEALKVLPVAEKELVEVEHEFEPA